MLPVMFRVFVFASALSWHLTECAPQDEYYSSTSVDAGQSGIPQSYETSNKTVDLEASQTSLIVTFSAHLEESQTSLVDETIHQTNAPHLEISRTSLSDSVTPSAHVEVSKTALEESETTAPAFAHIEESQTTLNGVPYPTTTTLVAAPSAHTEKPEESSEPPATPVVPQTELSQSSTQHWEILTAHLEESGDALVTPTISHDGQTGPSGRPGSDGAPGRTTVTLKPKPVVQPTDDALEVPDWTIRTVGGGAQQTVVIPGAGSEATQTPDNENDDDAAAAHEDIPDEQLGNIVASLVASTTTSSAAQPSATTDALPQAYSLGPNILEAGSSALVVEGKTYSLAPSGSAVYVNGVPRPVPATATGGAQSEDEGDEAGTGSGTLPVFDGVAVTSATASGSGVGSGTQTSTEVAGNSAGSSGAGASGFSTESAVPAVQTDSGAHGLLVPGMGFGAVVAVAAFL